MEKHIAAALVVAGALASACKPQVENPYGCKLQVPESQSRPYIVDWESDKRGDLQARARRGVVVVEHMGCSMRILDDCQVDAKYRWEHVGIQKDSVKIDSVEGLWANLPLGASKLEADFRAAGSLRIEALRIGKWEAPGSVDRSALRGNGCKSATHIIASIATGAFQLQRGTESGAAAGAGGGGAGAGFVSQTSSQVMTSDGVIDTCTADATAGPPVACAAFIRLLVAPIGVATHSCDPNDAADCTEQCARGHALSCQRLAAIHASQHDDVRASDLFKRGCDTGDERACNNFGVMMIRGRGVTHDLPRARQILTRACDVGIAEACSNAGFAIARAEDGGDNRTPFARTDSDKRLRRACDKNIAVACYGVGGRLNDDGRTYANADAAALLAKGCELRHAYACSALAHLRWDNQQLAQQLLRRACDYGQSGACPGGQATAQDAWHELVLVPSP